MFKQYKLNKNLNKTDYLIVILAFFSVSPFFANITNLYLFLFLIFLVFIANNRKINLINQKIIWLLLAVYTLIAIQGIVFKGFSYAALYVPLNLFFVPYIIYRLLGVKFYEIFIKVLFIVALFTTPIWLLQSISKPFDNLLTNLAFEIFPFSWGTNPRSLLLYTSPWHKNLFNESLGFYRNSGFFHEPGAYAVFLNIGLILNNLIHGKYFDIKNRVFIFCILTTLSTTGFIALFIILITFLSKQKISPLIKIIIAVIFIYISVKTYQTEEFLQSKVQAQYDDQLYAVQNKLGTIRGQSGRFFAFYTSLNQFMQYPIYGRGILIITSAKSSGEMHEDSSYIYGFMGVFATYGVFFGFFYIFYLFKGVRMLGNINNQGKFFVVAFFIAMMLLLSTQVFITSSFIVTIFTSGFISSKSKILFNT